MQSLIGTARNIRLFLGRKTDGGTVLVPEIEAVLTLSEICHEPKDQTIVPVERINTLRFTMNLEAAKLLSESLDNWIEEAESVDDLINQNKPQDL
jgi:hypothetical protein